MDDGDDAGCCDAVEDLQLFYASLLLYGLEDLQLFYASL